MLQQDSVVNDRERADLISTYAERLGWTLIPIWQVRSDGTCGCGDSHADRPNNIGKHPITQLVPNGIADGSSNPATIRSWCAAAPQANWGLVCDRSGLVVIDIDPRHDGEATWSAIEANVEGIPHTMRAKTGGGGWHLFFQAPAGVRFRGNIGRGVDVKHHGYVLIPPSNHASGGSYAWETSQVRPAELGWLRPIVEVGTVKVAGLDTGSVLDFEELFAGVSEGQRHDTFKSYAASLRARKVKYPEAKVLVEVACAAAEGGQHAFPLEEALQLLTWAYTDLKEGTSAEQELEQYKGYLDTLKLQAHPSGGDPTQSNGSSNGDGHVSHSIIDRIQALPEALRDGVISELLRRDVRRAAQQIMNAEDFKLPIGGRLDELISRGSPLVDWTIESLFERGTNMSLTAQFKTGKTTFQLNLMKALVDEQPFLDMFPVAFPAGNVAFFNYELTEETFIRWAGRMSIVHPERVHVLNMRGYKLDIGDPYVQEWLISWLRARDVKFWFVDPLARAYYGDENDNTQLKLWTDALDFIKQEAGVKDCLVSLHTGRGETEAGQERARGATRIDDWVDGRMLLTKQADMRFVRAEGREIEVPEMMLAFNPETWHLAVSNLTPIDRRAASAQAGIQHVVDTLRRIGATAQAQGMNKSALRNAIRQGRIADRGAWIDAAMNSGDVKYVVTQRGGHVLWVED